LGCDPNRSLLFAQVMSGDPEMRIDEENYLRNIGWQGKTSNVFLGDIANVSLRSLGPHDPPKFSRKPDYDEQQWALSSSAGELKINIKSVSYWGFGLWAKCFYNEIELIGPLSLRARCVHDIMASLGRNPWEASRVKKFEKMTNASLAEHGECWRELSKYARNEMEEEINVVENEIRLLIGTDPEIKMILENAKNALEDARAALLDRNAPAVERALGRAITALIEANPDTEVRSSELDYIVSKSLKNQQENTEVINANDLLNNEIDFVDLTESE
ncbi:MAG: hypothetical protein CMA51_01170, partial [Euryarchaeota archaeon]|nr:hypothetical protein [Euryarchaeota archaeon]